MKCACGNTTTKRHIHSRVNEVQKKEKDMKHWHWKVIDDSSVRHIWVCSDENCPSTEIDNKHRGVRNREEIRLSPSDYSDIGVPICSECGNDLEYVRTEIYQTKTGIYI